MYISYKYIMHEYNKSGSSTSYTSSRATYLYLYTCIKCARTIALVYLYLYAHRTLYLVPCTRTYLYAWCAWPPRGARLQHCTVNLLRSFALFCAMLSFGLREKKRQRYPFQQYRGLLQSPHRARLQRCTVNLSRSFALFCIEG